MGLPEDSYICDCVICKQEFVGHKSHITCRYCDKAVMEEQIKQLETKISFYVKQNEKHNKKELKKFSKQIDKARGFKLP